MYSTSQLLLWPGFHVYHGILLTKISLSSVLLDKPTYPQETEGWSLELTLGEKHGLNPLTIWGSWETPAKLISLTLHGFVLWQEAHTQDNMQTPHRKSPAAGSNPQHSCCETTVHLFISLEFSVSQMHRGSLWLVVRQCVWFSSIFSCFTSLWLLCISFFFNLLSVCSSSGGYFPICSLWTDVTKSHLKSRTKDQVKSSISVFHLVSDLTCDAFLCSSFAS